MRYFCVLMCCVLLGASLRVEAQHLTLARAFVGTSEQPRGCNCGQTVEMFQRPYKCPRSPWCAAYVSYVLDKTGAIFPKYRGCLARGFITKSSIPAAKVLRGEVKIDSNYLAVWQHGNTVQGHVAFTVRQIVKNKIRTNEGNTTNPKNEGGSQREGYIVAERTRSIIPSNYFRITYFTEIVYATGRHN